MKIEWNDDDSDKFSVHRAIPEGSVIKSDAKMTFGIEMEFLVPYIIKGQSDPHADEDSRPVIELTEEEARFSSGPTETVLRQIRTKIEKRFGKEETYLDSDFLMMGFRGMGNKDHKRWHLKEDHSLTEFAFSEDDGYAGWVSVEIASRKFYSYNANDFARNDFVIGQIARLIRCFIRCRINDTCGLHVHVGLEDTLPSKLHGLKKLATVLWLADDLLENLYHPCRREENRPLNFYCRSMKHCSALATSRLGDIQDPDDEFYKAYLQDIFQQDQSLALKMSYIWGAKSTEDLIKLLRPASGILERLSYNFQSLSQGGTIEFRAMESTMNEELLKHWPYLCRMLLFIAKRSPNADVGGGGKTESDCYRNLIQELVERPADLDVWKFLKMIYVDQRTIEFFKKKHEWDAESWDQLKAHGSPRQLHQTTFSYRPSAPFFVTERKSEYGTTG